MPRILVVDDELGVRESLRMLLKDGSEVITAAGVDEGLRAMAETPPDLILLDLVMPGRSGFDLLTAVSESGDPPPVIVLTATRTVDTAVEAIKLGATHYLAKPTDVDAILAAFEATAPQADFTPPSQPLSVDRLEWEHIQRVLKEHDGNISSTARALKMHRRTLQRKLAEADLTYQQLVDDTRRDLALRYIEEPGKSVTDITFLLGFSEQSAFTRAFKRWHGKSPSAYREQSARA